MRRPRSRRSLTMSICHPEERHHAAGLCRRCYLRAQQAGLRRRVNVTGLTRLGEIPPRPIGGVLQRRVLIDPDCPLEAQLPARCDKCGNPWLTLIGREVQCRGVLGGCGRTWYLVSGIPLRAETPSERTRYRQRAKTA